MGEVASQRVEIKKIELGRIVWTLFTFFYLSNFTKNLFSDIFIKNMYIPWILCVMIFGWLGTEYYFHALFFQSSLIEPFNPFLRFLFATYFYSFVPLSFYDYFHYGAKIHFVFSLPGIFLAAYGIYLKIQSLIIQRKEKKVEKILKKNIYRKYRHPRYLGLFLIILGILGATFSLRGAVESILGFLLLVISIRYEEKKLKEKYGKFYKEYLDSISPFIVF